MSNKKYQIFVSSTFRDLREERQDAIKNILDLNHIPAGMELFPASDTDQLVYIKKVIDECDYYILIMGGRYGSQDEAGISFTEREYDYAVETGKVVLAFVHGEPDAIPVGKAETSAEAQASLEAFRAKVMGGRLVRHWTTRENLEPLVLKALIHATNNSPQTGWIRADAAASADVLQKANETLEENSILKQRLAEFEQIQVVKIPNLAGLDDSFEYSYSYHHQYNYGSRTEKANVSFTWREIFLSLAVKLEMPKESSVIHTAFKRALKNRGIERDRVVLSDTDAARIKLQLSSLGLITYRVSKATNGNLFEFISLTPSGQAELLSNIAVRKEG